MLDAQSDRAATADREAALCAQLEAERSERAAAERALHEAREQNAAVTEQV